MLMTSGQLNTEKHLKNLKIDRQKRTENAANLKIEVAERFQPVVDEFLKQLK
jgi:hypothetical protein